MHDSNTSSRRDFLRTGSTLAAGAALVGGLGIARGAHAAGKDEVKVALVGCGGRGTGAAEQCLSVAPNVKLVAMADVFADRLTNSLKNLRKVRATQLDVPAERQFVGFDAAQKAIDCGADIILLCTPPGFRPMHYAAAIAAGKHVFMEKPCCIDAPGFRKLMETNKLADEKGLKVTVGMQRRHSTEYIDPVKAIQDGALGELRLIRAYWNGEFMASGFRRRTGPEMEFQIRNWNFFRWLSGDHIVEQHVHNIDVCNWIKNDHPVEAHGMGGRSQRKNAQIFDHHTVDFKYQDGLRFLSECRQMAGCWNCIGEFIEGSKGQRQFTTGGGDGYVGEHRDLIAAMRNGTKLNDGWHGATSSMTGVLGRMATYSGQLVKWDEAVAEGPSEMPETLALDANPPQLPDRDGTYPVPVPGMYKPY